MTNPLPRSIISTFSALSSAPRQRANPWICRECLHSQPQQVARNRFSTSQTAWSQAGKRTWREKVRIPREKRKVALAATVVFVAGAGALAFSEQARHYYTAVERSGRVAITLALCVNEYVMRLGVYDGDWTLTGAQLSQDTQEA
jgi:aarF domain-containing kinase